ncbi:MAG TPA: C4-type zinc ribbon domain-containing protein [Terriglobales bacterium]|nr:C4-type zinc ribbon domain-containing protein [Terriglobales bacterium]
MLPDVQNLIDLKRADREILRLKEEIATLPKRVAAIEQRLAGTKTALEKAREAVKGDEASRRKYDSAIQDLQQKISKYREQSLAVKTNDQYRALMHEIQFAEQDIRANEDKILDLMVNAEIREKEVKAAEARLKAETAEIEKEKEEARRVTALDEKELAEWNTRRDAARAGVKEDLLRHYDRVLKFRGSGLAEVRDQRCMGCQVLLRPQTYNDVRGGKTVECESCQRILYFDPATEVAVQKPSATAKKRARPKIHVSRAWFYRPDFDQVGEVFIAVANSEARCSCRVYDAHSGRKIGITRNREGDFINAFAYEIGSGIQLRSGFDEKQLDDWGSELPSAILDDLHSDLKVARAQTSVEETQSSETPAAS